jgi:hypothetical protein
MCYFSECCNISKISNILYTRVLCDPRNTVRAPVRRVRRVGWAAAEIEAQEGETAVERRLGPRGEVEPFVRRIGPREEGPERRAPAMDAAAARTDREHASPDARYALEAQRAPLEGNDDVGLDLGERPPRGDGEGAAEEGEEPRQSA